MDSATNKEPIKPLKDTLIILSGSPRGGQATWKSMVKNLQEPLDADVAVLYGDNFKLPKYLYDIAKYNWEFDEPANWRHYLLKYYSEDLPNFFIRGVENGLAGIDGLKGSGAIIFSLLDILFQNHLETLLKYKHVIYTRFDQYYFMTYKDILKNEIQIPEGEDYFGINDRFIVLPNSSIESFFSICRSIESKYSKLDYEFLNTNSVLNEHIKYLSKNFEIKRTRRVMATVASKGDETRWRKAELNFFSKRNLKFKYPGEFMQSISYLLESPQSLRTYFKNIPSILQFLYLSLRIKLGPYKKKYLKK